MLINNGVTFIYYRNTINLAHSISERVEMNKVYFAKKLLEISEVKNKTRKLKRSQKRELTSLDVTDFMLMVGF